MYKSDTRVSALRTERGKLEATGSSSEVPMKCIQGLEAHGPERVRRRINETGEVGHGNTTATVVTIVAFAMTFSLCKHDA